MIAIVGPLIGFFVGLLMSDAGQAYFRRREQRKVAARQQENARRLEYWWSGVPCNWQYEAVCNWYTAGPYPYQNPHSCPNARNEPYPELLKD